MDVSDWQTFGDCTDNNGYGNRNCIHDETNPLKNPIWHVASEKGFRHDSNNDSNCTYIAECRDLLRQLAKFDLKRGFAVSS